MTKDNILGCRSSNGANCRVAQISLVSGAGFVVASIGTALAPNLGAFFFFRLFTAFQGTSFLLNGAAVIR